MGDSCRPNFYPAESGLPTLYPSFSALMLNIPTTEERLGKSPQRLVRYFVLVMALVYVGLGIWLLYSSAGPAGDGFVQMGPTARRVLGGVLVGYGLLRFVRSYLANFRKKSTAHDE